ncbi:MAG: N-acetylmuramoyl-L-alanine amidase [Clostridia bacterium]|nr:N-acetylmuramoyl-L-alanine amidase [Clostridia bacterium]
MNTHYLMFASVLLVIVVLLWGCSQPSTAEDITPAPDINKYFSTPTDLTTPDAPQPISNVICIDAGHGGYDAGAVYGNRQEKDDNLALALLVAFYIKEAGYTPLLTRTDDTFLSLSQRCEIANQSNALLFLSVHRNSFKGARGVEVWINSQPSYQETMLAKNILSNLEKVGIQRNRGIKQGTQSSAKDDYVVNRDTDMPSCIIELGFMTDDTDNHLFDDNLNEYAKAIADAVISVLN